jgi:hypothetical protein
MYRSGFGISNIKVFFPPEGKMAGFADAVQSHHIV